MNFCGTSEDCPETVYANFQPNLHVPVYCRVVFSESLEVLLISAIQGAERMSQEGRFVLHLHGAPSRLVYIPCSMCDCADKTYVVY